MAKTGIAPNKYWICPRCGNHVDNINDCLNCGLIYPLSDNITFSFEAQIIQDLNSYPEAIER